MSYDPATVTGDSSGPRQYVAGTPAGDNPTPQQDQKPKPAATADKRLKTAVTAFLSEIPQDVYRNLIAAAGKGVPAGVVETYLHGLDDNELSLLVSDTRGPLDALPNGADPEMYMNLGRAEAQRRFGGK